MNRVLIDCMRQRTGVAYMEDGNLVELYYVSKNTESLVGNIYNARVSSVHPNLQAAFLDIGEEKNAYWYYGEKRATSDVKKNKNRPKQGDIFPVQVIKDAVGTKGAVVTREISFPGKFLVLLPTEAGQIGISAKIMDSAERERIRSCIAKLLPEGYGVIVRTNGYGRKEEAYAEELTKLLQKAEALRGASFRTAPALLYGQQDPLLSAVRDFYMPQVEEYIVNDEAAYQKLLQTNDFNADNQPKLVLYQESIPLFDAYFVESASKKALDEKVWLKSGGFLVIQQTEACVVIDVNTGKSAGRGDLQKNNLRVNLEAAKEAAAQIRLRNLSGIIIIDFIDMIKEEDKQLLEETLKSAVAKDRIKTVVVGMTELGLMQLTRKKTKPPLHKQITTECRSCGGSGRVLAPDYIVDTMQKQILRLFSQTIYNEVTVEAEENLLRAFLQESEWIKKVELCFSKKIVCTQAKRQSYGYFAISGQKK